MSERTSITLDDLARKDDRILSLETAIKRLPIFIDNGRGPTITNQSPDLTLALEELLRLACEND